MRDIDLQATEDFKAWSTRVDTGAPTDVTSIAVSAYLDNSVTQLTAGITTTNPFDSVTGMTNVRVVATVANGYAYGSTYTGVITTGTVNSVSVTGAPLFEFTIGKNRPCLVRMGLCQASSSTTCVFDSATSFADDFLNGHFIYISAGTGAGQSRFIDDWTNSSDTATISPAWTTTPSTDSVFQCYATPPGSTGIPLPVNMTQAGGGTVPSGAIPNAVAGASGGLIISGTNSQLTITGALTVSGGVVITQSSSNTAGLAITGNGTGNGATITSGSGATGVALALVAASTNGSALTAAGVGTGHGVLSTGGVTGHGLSLVGGATSGSGLSSVASASGSGIVATGVGTTKPGILATGGATTSAGIHAVGGATSGDGILSVASTSGHGIVGTGVGTTKHGMSLTGGSTTSAGLAAAGGGAGAGVLVTAGATGIGLSVNGGGTSGDGIKVVTVSGHGLNLAPVGSSMHGIFATGGNGGTSDGVNFVAGTGGKGLRAATTTTDILTQAMTESYAPDGAAASATQAMYSILQALTEFSTSTTTITVKKRDASTTAFTMTVDSASAPTSITQAS